MLFLDHPTTFSYLVLGVVTIFGLPSFLRRALAFKREFDDYRAQRRKR